MCHHPDLEQTAVASSHAEVLVISRFVVAFDTHAEPKEELSFSSSSPPHSHSHSQGGRIVIRERDRLLLRKRDGQVVRAVRYDAS